MHSLQGMIMTMRKSMPLVSACLLALASVVFVLPTLISTAGDQTREPITVHFSDIPERVQIVGRLGQPLGQVVTVRGSWIALPQKPAPPVLVVTQLNGRPLDPPARFDHVEPVWIKKKNTEFARKTVGEEWELRGVETGGFVGFSDKVWEELGQQPSQRPPRGFLTRFCYVRAKPVSGAKPIAIGKE